MRKPWRFLSPQSGWNSGNDFVEFGMSIAAFKQINQVLTQGVFVVGFHSFILENQMAVGVPPIACTSVDARAYILDSSSGFSPR